MHLLKTFVAITFLVFTMTVEAASLECRNLFVSSANVIADADVEQRIENLAISFLKISETQIESKQQVIAYINKELRLLEQVDKDSLFLFKEKVSELSKSTEDSRNKKAKENEAKRKEREAIVESQDPFRIGEKITFHEIKPRKFMMGEIGKQVETEITKPFAMMQTQVTQMMWATLKIAMGEKKREYINPSQFKTGDGSETVNIEGINVQMKPYHPVEKVNHYEIREFLIGLNKLSNSSDVEDQALLRSLIRDHKKGEIYDLPTEAQWEFVMRNRGNAKEQFFDKTDDSELSKYAFYGQPDHAGTNAVASMQPRMIDGKPFYDLEGNVWEWTKDWNGELTGDIDPQGPSVGLDRIIRGGSWSDRRNHLLSSGNRSYVRPSASSDSIGFRLVRTRP